MQSPFSACVAVAVSFAAALSVHVDVTRWGALGVGDELGTRQAQNTRGSYLFYNILPFHNSVEYLLCSLYKVAAMTERGQLATEAQRNDMEMLVERLEELKADDQLEPFKDENMVILPSTYNWSATNQCVEGFFLCREQEKLFRTAVSYLLSGWLFDTGVVRGLSTTINCQNGLPASAFSMSDVFFIFGVQ